MRYLISLFILISFTGCLTQRTAPAPPAILAFVNGESIKENDLRYRLNLELSKYEAKEEPLEDEDSSSKLDKDTFMQIKEDLLNDMIESKIIIQWGTKQGIVLEPSEKAYGIQLMKKGYTDESFELMLQERQVPIVKWSELAEEKLLVKKIINVSIGDSISITDQDMRNYYNKNRKQFEKKESVRVRHIVTDTQEKADHLRERIMEGENFSKLAIMHSLSPDRSRGGDLGYFSRGTFPQVFDDICFHLKPNELSPVVKSPYGYHIFRLIDKQPEKVQSFEQVKGMIEAEIFKKRIEEAYVTWFNRIKEKAQIQIFKSTLKEMEQ